MALYFVAFANALLIVMTLPRPPKVTGVATMIVCGGLVLLDYREDPGSFHRPVSRSKAVWIILTPIVSVVVVIVLGRNNLL
jgi:hypothetical protein